MPYYKALVESVISMRSSKKQTPGLEFGVLIRRVAKGGSWVECDEKRIRVWLWFSGGGNEVTLKKLEHAGWKGESLADLNLTGQWVTIESHWEDFRGKKREKYELALPPREETVQDDEAFLAISAAMSGASVGMTAPPAPESADVEHSDAPEDVPF